MKIRRIPICATRSQEISPKFTVLCTEAPGHEGDHRTIYSVDPSASDGFEYSWPQQITIEV